MSVQAITWAFEQDLDCGHKFVLVALANYADEEARCWPSQDKLAKQCGLSRQRVNVILGDLEEFGLIGIIPQTRDNGSTRSNVYQLAAPLRSNHPRPIPDTPGFLYVAWDGSRAKIGITRDVEERMKSLSKGASRPVTLVKAFAVEMRLARRIEKQLHAENAALRLHGEWYNLRPEEAVSLVVRAVASRDTTLSSCETAPCQTMRQEGVAPEDRQVSPDKTTTKRTSKLPDEPDALNEPFEALWAMWPAKGRVRSKAKAKVLEQFKRTCDKHEPEAILNATKLWLRTITPDYAPALDRFLRDGRFEHHLPSGNVVSIASRDGPDWPAILSDWLETGAWKPALGPTPDQPGYRGPLEPIRPLLEGRNRNHPVIARIWAKLEPGLFAAQGI